MIEIKVPSLGESVTEATIAKWHKKVGEKINSGDILVELETDKVTLEVPSPSGGQITEILIGDGENVVIDQVIGKIQDDSNQNQSLFQPEEPKNQAKDHHIEEGDSVILSPSAKRLVMEESLDPYTIKGTGKDGRITKEDVMLANQKKQEMMVMAKMEPKVDNSNEVASLRKNLKESSDSKSYSSCHSDDISQVNLDHNIERRVPMTRLRKTIAQRLKTSQNTTATLTTFNEIDLFEVIRIRKEYQEIFRQKHSIKLGFMSFFVKATVNALKEFPVVNSMIDGDDIVYKDYYNIGVAVGTDNGLVVPVVKNASFMSLAEIEDKILELSMKAREGKITVNDMSGGTFSITNGGIYGSMLSTPIINPPQSAILGMHNITERATVLANGQIAARPIMFVALSYDHRLIDGKEAVQFLVRVKEQIEKPEKMLLSI